MCSFKENDVLVKCLYYSLNAANKVVKLGFTQYLKNRFILQY